MGPSVLVSLRPSGKARSMYQLNASRGSESNRIVSAVGGTIDNQRVNCA